MIFFSFSLTVGEIITATRKIPASTSIQEAAGLMSRFRAGSLLIHDPDDLENFLGIITDRDIRGKVVAAGLDYRKPVSDNHEFAAQDHFRP